MRKPLMIFLLILLCAVALAGGLVAAVGPAPVLAMLTGGGESHAAEPAEVATESGGHGAGGHAGAKADPSMPVLPFPEIIVNVTDTTPAGRKTSRFLKLNVALVYDDAIEGADRVPAREIYMRDAFQDFLRQLNVEDIQGSAGMAMLKTELLRRARAISDSAAPQEFLIADLIVQ